MPEFKKFSTTFIMGTRPEAIKLAPVIKTFQECESFEVKIILSGQHEEMVSEVMRIFDIKADANFNTLKRCNSIDDLTSEIIKELSKIYKKQKPDIVFVQGDTTTALAASLSAFFNKIPIAHIEAGLRTENIFSPFPEEANRRIISQISTLHFAPTKLAVTNLAKNGIKDNVFNSGNTVIDALEIALKEKKIKILKELNIQEEKYIVVTVHRRENWGDSIKIISQSILKIINQNNKIKFVFPLHKNPSVRNLFQEYLKDNKKIILIEPLPYLEFIYLLKKSYFVLTDSGGIQEEASTLGKPTVILRDYTERPEVISNGNACLVGRDQDKIIKTVNSLLKDKLMYLSMSKKNNEFGNGKTSNFVLLKTLEYLNKGIDKN